MIIRRAKVNESQEIRKFEEKVWNEKNITSKYDMANAVRFNYVFVAVDKNKIIGLILATKTRKDDIYVDEWIVDKKYRGKGIGRKLYKKLMEDVGNKKMYAFTQISNKISQKAHYEMGFTIVKKIEDAYNLGQPRLLMIKSKSKS